MKKRKIRAAAAVISIALFDSMSACAKEEGPYVPLTGEHCFSLIEEGYETPVLEQGHTSSCWAYSSVTVMASDMLVRHGVNVSFNPLDLVDLVFDGDPGAGIEGHYCEDPMMMGGTMHMVIAAMADQSLDGYYVVEANDYSNCPRERIQEQLREGALTCLIYVLPPDYLKFPEVEGNLFYNTPGTEFYQMNHMLTIVGYDDNIPADWFDPVASQNGAWLLQDSQGAEWANDGYFWLSYDTPLYGVCDYELSDAYSEVVSYDGGVNSVVSIKDSYAGGDSEGGVSTANYFEHSGTVGAIGTYTGGPDETISVEIREDLFGRVLWSSTETFEFTGYHTIEVDEPLGVESFTVIVNYPEYAPVEGEDPAARESDDQIFTMPIGYCATIEPGQSYILVNGEWVDMSNPGVNDCLLFGRTGDQFPLGWNRSDVANNACIKVLFK